MNATVSALLRRLLFALLLVALCHGFAHAQSWRRLGSLTGGTIATLARGADGVLIATGTHWLCRSTDEGATWQQSLVRMPSTFRLATGGNLVVVVGPATLGISTDRGATWSTLRDQALRDSLGDIASAIVVDGTIYIGNLTRVLRSADTGRSWESRSVGLPETYPQIGTMAVMPDGRLVGGSQGLFGGNIYLSDDTVGSWRPIFTKRQPSEDLPNAVAATSKGTILAGIYRHGIIRSTDLGETWHDAAFELRETEKIRTFLTTDVELYAVTSDGRILVSTNDGVSWSEVTSAGLPRSGALSFLPLGGGRFLAGNSDGLFELTLVAGVDDPVGAAGFSLSPTPSTDGAITVRRDNATATARWSLADVLGRRLHTGELAAGASTLHLEGLSGGRYLLRIVEGHRAHVLPVVIVR